MKPTYAHDCGTCQFLGATIGGGRIVDCYAHVHDDDATLVARYGDDGPEYYSGSFVRIAPPGPRGHSELLAAYALWKEHPDRT